MSLPETEPEPEELVQVRVFLLEVRERIADAREAFIRGDRRGAQLKIDMAQAILSETKKILQ